MIFKPPHTLNESSSNEEIIEVLEYIKDMLEHGLDERNFAAGTLTNADRANRYYLNPFIFMAPLGNALANTNIGTIAFDPGNAYLFATSMWSETTNLGGDVFITYGAGTTLHSYTPTVTDQYSAQYNTDVTSREQDGYAVGTDVNGAGDTSAGAETFDMIIIIGWVKSHE